MQAKLYRWMRDRGEFTIDDLMQSYGYCRATANSMVRAMRIRGSVVEVRAYRREPDHLWVKIWRATKTPPKCNWGLHANSLPNLTQTYEQRLQNIQKACAARGIQWSPHNSRLQADEKDISLTSKGEHSRVRVPTLAELLARI